MTRSVPHREMQGIRVSLLKRLAIVLFVCFCVVPLRVWASEDVVSSVLNNGLRVVIVRNTLAPVVAIQMNYLVGANEDPSGLPGMAHAQEHMMFRGSPGLSADQLSSIIADLGGEFNANTQQTVTQYYFSVPDGDLEIALRVEAVRMKGVLDAEKLWKHERGAIGQEVAQDLSSPEYVFSIKLREKMFGGSPYARDALGTKESFDRMTGRMLRNFHKSWYGPNNAVLVIVGNIDMTKTLEMVRHLFEPIPARPIPRRGVFELKPQVAETINLETDLSYGLAVVAYRLPGYDSPDYAAGQILADVLGSKRGDIYALVPQGKALSADFSYGPLPKAAMGYATAAFPKGGDGLALVSALRDVVAGYVKDGIPADLVEASKRQEAADYESQKNSVEGLATLWSEALAIEGRESPDVDISAIKKVTADDVWRVARDYLNNDTAITAVLEPRYSGKAVSSMRTRGKESFVPKKTKHIPLPLWAKKAASLPAPSSVVNPVVTVLPNGLRLITISHKVSKTVSVYGRIKNNPSLQVPEGQEGVDEILDQLFTYGTTTLDRLTFHKRLDDIAARESAGTSFSLHVLSEQFNVGMGLLADNVLSPALPEEAFTVVKQKTIGALRGLLLSPSYLSRRALLAALYPADDPKQRQATTETVSKLRIEDVKNYYRKVFRPDMTTIVVIGDITPTEARSVVSKYFGDWKSEGPKPEVDLPPVPLNKVTSTVVPNQNRVQDEVTLAQTLGLRRADPDYYKLQVGRHILTGAFYATRLYQDLREKTGLVYAVEAFLDAGKTRSNFMVSYASDPRNVAKARTIVERDLLQMQKELVNAEELRRAKTLLIRQIPLSEASVDDIADRLLHLSLEDLPLDEPLRAAEKYREITRDEVRAAFRKWIRPHEFVQVVEGPVPIH